MDRKAKKKLDTLRLRVNQLQKQLKGAKEQVDEPGEVERLTQQIAAAQAEIERLKSS
jgi:DNA-binding FrmR family transcriptional regulator